MNTISGLNHLTLAVSNLQRSVAFYSGLLGFAARMRGPTSAYLEAGTLWLALVVDPDVRRGPLPEYSHVAFGVGPSELPALAHKLTGAGVPQWRNQSPLSRSISWTLMATSLSCIPEIFVAVWRLAQACRSQASSFTNSPAARQS